jgi:AcrR family transcriptional regulator
MQVDAQTDTRTLLLRQAARLFALRGYDAVSVREIVEAAGVTKPAVYYHFGNKEGLARAVLQEMVEAAVKVRESAFSRATNPKQAFVMHARGMLGLVNDFRETMAFGISVSLGRSSLKELVTYTERVHETFTRSWMELLTGMGLKPDVAGQAIKWFWALLQHEMVAAASCPKWDGDIERTAEQIAQVVLYGVLGQDHESR